MRAAISLTRQSACAVEMRPLAPCWNPSASTRAIDRASAASDPDATEAVAVPPGRAAGALSSLHAARAPRHSTTAAIDLDMGITSRHGRRSPQLEAARRRCGRAQGDRARHGRARSRRPAARARQVARARAARHPPRQRIVRGIRPARRPHGSVARGARLARRGRRRDRYRQGRRPPCRDHRVRLHRHGRVDGRRRRTEDGPHARARAARTHSPRVPARQRRRPHPVDIRLDVRRRRCVVP